MSGGAGNTLQGVMINQSMQWMADPERCGGDQVGSGCPGVGLASGLPTHKCMDNKQDAIYGTSKAQAPLLSLAFM